MAKRLTATVALAALVLAAAGSISTAGAEEVKREKRAVFSLGASNSKMIGSDGFGTEPRPGKTYAFAYIRRIGKVAGFETGVRYSQRGSRGRIDTRFIPGYEDQGFIVDGTVKLDYIDLPFLVSGFWDFGKHVMVRAYGGGSFNFVTNATVEGTLDGSFFELEIKDAFNSFEIAGVLGASYSYLFTTATVYIDGRYTVSLQSIQSATIQDVRNSTIQLTVGVGIPLGI